MGKLTVEEAFGIVHILLQVVDEMNQKGFVHRDIKPANIIIDFVDDEKCRGPRAKKKYVFGIFYNKIQMSFPL